MVLNELVYDPGGSNNSALFSLVKGTITFVAGQRALRAEIRRSADDCARPGLPPRRRLCECAGEAEVADDGVFARDEPGKAGVQFVTLPTAACRAASAPDAGWSPG